MEDFTSAEGVTRFLRAKNSVPETVFSAARRLLNGEYSLYLPNSAMFVFDLLCDRASELTGKNFVRWKFCPELWWLWNDVWNRLGSEPLDREIRSRSFRRVKTISVASAVLDEAAARIEKDSQIGPDTVDLLNGLFLCLDTFSTSGYIDVDEFSAMGLLKSYSYMLFTMDREMAKTLPIDDWTALVKRIYELPHQVVTYKPSKRSMTKYFAEILPIHLMLFERATLPEESHNYLHSIFAEVLFTLEKHVLPAQIATTMASPPDFLDNSGVSLLFQEVITNLASSDIKACEEIYLKLTVGRFSAMAAQLINVLSKVNKTLSSSFFAETYAKENAQPNPDWTLISHLLQLDPELTTSKWKDVVHGSAKEPLCKIVLIADNISSGFVRARDFSLFASEVFPYALTMCEHWASPEVLAKLTPKVNELSGNQISKLCSQFLETQSRTPLALLVQGLLFCSAAKQNAAQPVFENYAFCHPGWSEVAYYVLCVYGETVMQSQPDILGKVVAKSQKHVSKSDLDLVFRIAELTGESAHIDAKQVLAYIRSMEKKSVIPFAQRWIVVMQLVPGAYSAWLKRAFALLDAADILAYLKLRQQVLCELPAFLSELSTFLQSSKVSYIYDVVAAFPPVVFKKFFAGFLVQMCTEALAHPENATIRSSLRHVYGGFMFNSPLENDFALLRDFVEKAPESTTPDTLAIAEHIWSAHMNTIKTPQSKAYVEKAVASLVKNLKKPQRADLLISRVALSRKSAPELPDFERFLEKYVSVTCARMTTENIESQLSALSELPSVTENAKVEIRNTVRKFGSAQLSSQCQGQLFDLVTKTSDEKDTLFVVSLFVALCQSCKNIESIRGSLVDSLRAYLRTLSDDSYTDLFAHCITSLRDAPAEYVWPLVDTCNILCGFVKKDSEQAHAQLLVAFLSAFSERKSDIKSPATVLLFVHSIAKLLASQSWVFKQYTVELVLGIVHLLVHEPDFGAASEEVYVSVVKLMSHAVLFHRYRFRSRYHLVLKVVTDMMLPISNAGVLQGSARCASELSRLITSLCEPQTRTTAKDHDLLTSRVALYKQALQSHAHILLVNYIHTRLHHKFSGEVSDAMMPGIYSVFSLLSPAELQLVSKWIDNPGRAYFQTLYASYKDHGKWTE